jgi:lipopolysaccharide/colanic/teichoic acid biosynthesis glycosyltransferase
MTKKNKKLGNRVSFINDIIKHLNLRTRTSQFEGTPLISSEKVFSHSIELERARSDRNGHGFSLVTFHLKTSQFIDEPLVDQLTQYLFQNIRITDEIGWFDKNTIGVLLFNTPSLGAWKFVDNIKDGQKNHRSFLRCSVYTYPSDWSGFKDHNILPPNKKDNNVIDYFSSPSSKNHFPSKIDITNGKRYFYITTDNKRKLVYSLQSIFVRKASIWKRVFDIVGSCFALVLFAPSMIAVAIAIKCTSNGPIIFKQKRIGLGGKPFQFYKFRSMYVDAEEKKRELIKYNERNGPVFKMKNDPRITPVGRFIRKWSIDELPQFFNVLLGDMSLVGPRPPLVEEVEKYDRWHVYRLEVKPGLTCVWQVFARHEKSFENWVRLDIKYAQNQSLWYDLKLLLLTIPAVLSRRGAC